MERPELEHGVAQTNLRLYWDLVEQGWSDEDLGRARRAYDLALELFSARFRGNGKPFLCHLVGTADLLLRSGAPQTMVLAGLLHAAYLQGDFGMGRTGVTRARRRRVRRDVGPDVEFLVHAYSVVPWEPRAILDRIATDGEPDTLERRVVRMRLANELEECLDGGRAFSGKGSAVQFDDLIGLARVLGYPEMGEALERVVAEGRVAEIPDSLRRTRSGSFERLPASVWRRPRAAAWGLVDSALRFWRRRVG